MARNNMTRRFAASTAATFGAITRAPFRAVENCISGTISTLFETVVSPVESVRNGRIVEAPFDMVATAIKGVGTTVADTVMAVSVDAVQDGVDTYLDLAAEDANPKTKKFRQDYFG